MTRIPHVNIEHISLARAGFRDSIQKTITLIESNPSSLTVTRFSLLADDCFIVAMYDYALGEPLEKVVANLKRATAAYLRVLENRGTESPMPVWGVEMDLLGNAITPFAQITSADQRDFSNGNSVGSYEFCAVAYMAGEAVSARAIADRIWDPDDAQYVRWNSSYITPNQQAIAYGFRELIHGFPDKCLNQIKRVKPLKLTPYQHKEASCLKSLAENNRDAFKTALSELLQIHEMLAQRKENRNDPGFYVCRPAINFAVQGILTKLVLRHELPETPFLPLEMLDAGLEF